MLIHYEGKCELWGEGTRLGIIFIISDFEFSPLGENASSEERLKIMMIIIMP
jgi:hypothetical protein